MPVCNSLSSVNKIIREIEVTCRETKLENIKIIIKIQSGNVIKKYILYRLYSISTVDEVAYRENTGSYR